MDKRREGSPTIDGAAREAEDLSNEAAQRNDEPVSMSALDPSAAYVDPALVDSLIRANAGTDGITGSERAAARGAVEIAARDAALEHTSPVLLDRTSGFRLRRHPSQTASRIARALDSVSATAQATASQQSAQLYQDGEDRYIAATDDPHHRR